MPRSSWLTSLTSRRSLALALGGILSSVTRIDGALPEWQAAVGSGTPAASTYINDVTGPPISGQYPMSLEVGALSGDRSFEFIVFAGEAGPSSALMGFSGRQGLKFEQWNNTMTLGLTDFGVADHLTPEPSPFYADSHIVFAYDGTDTRLYLNGGLKHTFTGIPLDAAGQQWMAAVSDAGGITFGDRLDGHILGFASYDGALPAAEIAAHAEAFAQGNPRIFLTAWHNAVASGTIPQFTHFAPVSGLEPIVVDVGELSGLPSTFEFIVNAGEGAASSALLGRGGAGGQGLKFEQWNNTDFIGMTDFGVTDFSSDVQSIYNETTHIAYVSDGSDTLLFLNGEPRFTFAGVPLRLGGNVALGAAATITDQGTTTFRDVLDGTVVRFASYNALLPANEIAAHHTAFAADAGAGAFTAWVAAVNAGTAPAATHLVPATGDDQVVLDVGTLSGDRTFEFIVNAGDGTASGSLFGDRIQALKFEQWNDTGTLGLTNYGVADYDSAIPPPLVTDTHIVYASDGTDTHLYVDGVFQFTFAGLPLTGTGEQGLAAAAVIPAGGIIASYFDRLDGHVLGFASYASALSAEELALHARVLFEGTTAPPTALRITAFSRNPATAQMSLTWTSTVGKRYEINYSTDLVSFAQVLATGIPADTGTSTTRTFTAPVAGARQFYFRVKEL